MAFDRPIEADRVDDFGLFGSFVRAPIVAPLIWIFSGQIRARAEEDDRRLKQQQERNEFIEKYSLNEQSRVGMVVSTSTTKDIDIHTSECSLATLIDDEDPATQNQKEDSSMITESNHKKSYRRKMSWSDESGQSLVEYCDESMTLTQETTPTQALTKMPIKSAMKKPFGRTKFHPSECIPVIPSGGFVSNPGSAKKQGYISPQWGWYISTTPPTPEQYGANRVTSTRKDNQMTTIPSQSSMESGRVINSKVQGNEHAAYSNVYGQAQIVPVPVFTRSGTDQNSTYSNGWPTVPL